jgi:phosphatidylserine/phosphatidylglycerophosphate/cardiolipin synthase-like enzyme
MDEVEAWLAGLPEGTVITPSAITMREWSRLSTEEEAAVVAAALTDAGILQSGPVPSLCTRTLAETAGYRLGIRQGLDAPHPSTATTELCATVPDAVAWPFAPVLRNETSDLRAALFDMVAGARSRIVIASPFWDRSTVSELGELLRRRLQAGVRIDLLARLESEASEDYQALASRLPIDRRIRLFRWYERGNAEDTGTQTFHFKAAVVDGGTQAYLGSANMTLSGLRSRLELGVMLRGRPAVALSRVLEIVLGLATQVQLQEFS